MHGDTPTLAGPTTAGAGWPEKGDGSHGPGPCRVP